MSFQSVCTGSEREGSVVAICRTQRRHPSKRTFELCVYSFRGEGHTVVTADREKLLAMVILQSTKKWGENLRSLRTRVGALVPRVSRDTHFVGVWESRILIFLCLEAIAMGAKPAAHLDGRRGVDWSAGRLQDFSNSKRAREFGKCGRNFSAVGSAEPTDLVRSRAKWGTHGLGLTIERIRAKWVSKESGPMNGLLPDSLNFIRTSFHSLEQPR